jgi:hypothetical protein
MQSGPIATKTELPLYILVKISNTELNETPSGNSQDVSCLQAEPTD